SASSAGFRTHALPAAPRPRASWSRTAGCSPVNPLAEAEANVNSDAVHQQRHAEQNGTRRGSIDLERRIWPRNPVEHLDRHCRKRFLEPGERKERELALERRL